MRLSDFKTAPDLDKLGRGTPEAREWIRKVVRPCVQAAFRPTLEGFDNLPADRPYILVANHSGGLALAEILAFTALYEERTTTERPLAGFAHIVGFQVPPLRRILESAGAVPSTYEAAFAALERGVSLLVFPGGAHEALRPVWQANRVDFGGHKGFLRIAREAGVPVVPMGIQGSAWTAPMLWRSRALSNLLVLPRALGVREWGLSAVGLAGAATIASLPIDPLTRAVAVWLWLTTPLSLLPVVPATIRFGIGAPLEPDALFPTATDPDVQLVHALQKVEGRVQQLVYDLRDARARQPASAPATATV